MRKQPRSTQHAPPGCLTRHPTPDTRHPLHRPGFTLIEAALATVIVGTGVLSILAAQQAFHKKNDWAQRTATAVLLANELRELTLTLPAHDPISGEATLGPESDETNVANYDDLDDFAGPPGTGNSHAGLTFSPPINALRQPVSDLTGWSQEIKVENVLEDDISSTFTQPLGSTPLMRVTVAVRYQAPGASETTTLTTLAWIVSE